MISSTNSRQRPNWFDQLDLVRPYFGIILVSLHVCMCFHDLCRKLIKFSCQCKFVSRSWVYCSAVVQSTPFRWYFSKNFISFRPFNLFCILSNNNSDLTFWLTGHVILRVLPTECSGYVTLFIQLNVSRLKFCAIYIHIIYFVVECSIFNAINSPRGTFAHVFLLIYTVTWNEQWLVLSLLHYVVPKQFR